MARPKKRAGNRRRAWPGSSALGLAHLFLRRLSHSIKATGSAGLGFLFFLASPAHHPAEAAAPGDGRFLAGMQAQGPASSATSAVFHNPAMLADLAGLHAQVSLQGRWVQQWVATPQWSAPGVFSGSYGRYKAYNHLALNGFIGASFLFEDFAIAAAWYSLDNQSRAHAPAAYRGFVKKNPNLGCELLPGIGCKKKHHHGGYYEHRSELTIALAWQSLQRIRFGLSIHFPRYDLAWTRQYNAKQDPGYNACRGALAQDPSCETVQELDLRSRFRWFGLNERSSRLIFAFTTGIAYAPNDYLTLGARFRWRPNFGARPIQLHGTVEHCAATANEEECIDPTPRSVQMSQSEGRQLAVGIAWRFFAPRPLQLDAQVYWLQSCAYREQDCQDGIHRRFSALDFEADDETLVDIPVYRGRWDRFGAEFWLRNPLTQAEAAAWRRVQLNFGLGGESPGMRRAAHNIINDEGWRIWGAASTAIELLRRKAPLYILPGYALQWSLPRKVGSPADFQPQAWQDFQNSTGDIDTPAGQAVLQGRAQQSNTGAYSFLSHNLSLSLRWGELR